MGQINTPPDNYTKLYLCVLLSLAQEYSEWKASSWLATPIKVPSPITPWKASPPKHPSNPQGTTPGREHHPTKQEEIIPPVDLADSAVRQVMHPGNLGKWTTPTTDNGMHHGMCNILMQCMPKIHHINYKLWSKRSRTNNHLRGHATPLRPKPHHPQLDPLAYIYFTSGMTEYPTKGYVTAKWLN